MKARSSAARTRPASTAAPVAASGSEYLAPAAGEAEGQLHLRRAREAVPQPLRGGEPPAGRHRREPAAHARAAPRQRRLPRRLGAPPGRRPASSSATATSRSTASASTSPATASARATSSRSRDEGPRDDRHPPQHRHARPHVAAVARGRRRRQRRSPSATCRCASTSTCPSASSSSSSSTPSNLPAATTPSAEERTHAGHPASHRRSRSARTKATVSGSPSARSSPASATRSATRCAARCCRRSPARPSPQVRFDDALHEFDTIAGVTEDVTDIILNLKDIVLTSTADEPVTLRLDVRGPAEVTAGDIQLPRRRRDPQPRPAHRHAQRQGPPRRRHHRRARPWLRVGRPRTRRSTPSASSRSTRSSRRCAG